MTILVVEDNQDQIAIAKRELTALGYKVAIAKTLVDAKRLMDNLKASLKGVITDLHFPESNEPYYIEKTTDKPNGLSVIANAVFTNTPVVVCSDVNHHFCAYAENVINILATHQNYTYHRIPFGMDQKDWHRAGEELMVLIKKTETQ